MDEIRIAGGRPLCGTVSIQGSKNAALPIMAASLLHCGVSILKGCPKIADVFCMERILKGLGTKTWWNGNDLYLDCTNISKVEVSGKDTRQMRSSVILMGALLGRKKICCIGYPGGCVIGERPIDLHLCALRNFGVIIHETSEGVLADCDQLQGCEIEFSKKSVGATEQAVLAAVLAQGETVLRNCACEPEIRTLCVFLRKMGALIEGDGSSCIRIIGVKELCGGEICIPPDRIVAGTYLCACAATRGKITINNPPEGELDAFLEVYRKMGGQYKVKSGKLLADGSRICFPVSFLETKEYPGFPTDLQSPLLAVLATIPGRSRIRERIFEARFKAAYEMKRMGADIFVNGNDVWICGGAFKDGCTVYAEDLRGGAALVIAALAVKGETTVKGYSYIHRGYEHICEDLTALGGLIVKDTGTDFYENIQLQETF